MRASKGGLTHEQIMRLTWRQFGVYLDAFTWLLREEAGGDGPMENRKDDRAAAALVPELRDRQKRLVEDTKRDKEKWMQFAPGKDAPGVARNLLE